MKAKKLIEVAMPIKEISAESERDGRVSRGHIKTIHQWWARRPLPVCRAVVFASLVIDPLDENCPKAFRNAVSKLLGKHSSGIDIYAPYKDIPFTVVKDDALEDNLRNRLLMFIGKFSDACQNNMIEGKNTSSKDKLSDYSLIKCENKNNEKVLRVARELIWVAYNAEKFPNDSYEELHNKFSVFYNEIKKREALLYEIQDRHIATAEVNLAEANLKKAIEDFQDNMPSVFDPFAGGGNIPYEAARLGCRSFGNDINPVAHIIERSSAEFPQKYGKPIIYSSGEFVAKYGNMGLQMAKEVSRSITYEVDGYHIPNRLSFDVEYYAKQVLYESEKEIGWMYPDTDERKTIAYLWARTAKCSNPSCGAEVPMLKDFYLCNTSNKKLYLNPIIKGNDIAFEIKNGTCHLKSWQNRGSLICPCCGNITNAEVVKTQSVTNGLPERLLAVISDGPNGKEYSIPSPELIKMIYTLPEVPDELKPKEQLAANYTQALPCYTWGIRHWGDLFSNRQLTMLHTLVSNCKKVFESLGDSEYALVVKTSLSMWLDRVIRYNTSFSNYETVNEKLNRILVRQEIHMIFDFPESNPFCGIAGSALNQLDCILECLDEETSNPFFASFYNSSSGEKQQFKQKQITAVVTDPPYYDAMAYADLSDFYYVWLKQLLKDDYPMVFSTPQTPKTEECTALKHHHNNSEESAKKHFEHKLTQIFDAIEMQTSDIVSIMFAHQSTEAWTTLCNSILGARMNITGSWAMDTESKAGLKMDKAFLESSVTVACRPSQRQGFAEYKEVKRAIEKNVKEEVDKLYELGFRGADLLTACFGQAVSEFGKYEVVEKSNGDRVTVAELLELAREAAFNALLEGVQGDSFTKFYLGWLQLNGMGSTDYDDVTKFTRVGLPIDVREVFAQGLLVKEPSGNKQHLATAAEHLEGDHIAGTRATDLLIDQAHRAILFYKDENRPALLKLLRDINAQDANASFWRLLASLKELLPACDDLKQVQGLLQNGEDLRQASRQNEQPTTTQTTIEF